MDIFLMLRATEYKLKKLVPNDIYSAPTITIPGMFNGIPYEVYDTMLEIRERAKEIKDDGNKPIFIEDNNG